MANLEEWVKGVLTLLLGGLLYYFYWDNIFLYIINFVNAEDTILGAFAWVSFVLMFILTVPVYVIYTFIAGATDRETSPKHLLMAIGIWCVLMPFAVIVLALVNGLITPLESIGIMGATENALANKFSMFITLMGIVAMNVYPFIYIFKGYGLIKDKGEGGSND